MLDSINKLENCYRVTSLDAGKHKKNRSFIINIGLKSILLNLMLLKQQDESKQLKYHE